MTALELIETIRQIKYSNMTERESLQALSRALRQFAPENKERIAELAGYLPGGYFRHLLNSREDDFRVVLIFWGPRAVSAIHDHGRVSGAVASITGTLHEAKYRILDIKNNRAVLKKLKTRRLRQGNITPILAGDEGQVHLMMNVYHSIAASIHVYLSPVTHYYIYHPRADGTYGMEKRQVQDEQDNAWRMLETRPVLEIF